MTPVSSSEQAAIAVAQASYGRLLAWLAWRWRDIAAAEDALGDAFAIALQRWPRDGVPAVPEAWLLTTAKRRLLHEARHARVAGDPTLTILLATDPHDAAPQVVIPDDRLRLMFVCAHPAIDERVRTALMLQTVLGLDAARMAPAFLVSAEAMTKRLVRAKAKIKAAGIRFEEPDADELPSRLHAVLEAIYGAYAMRRSHVVDGQRDTLADEALFLAELVAARLPDEAEALGLLALLLFCETRKPAAVDADGDYVPLDRQETDRWDRGSLDRADRCLRRAAALRTPGAFQYEAAIQAAHCDRAITGATPWREIVILYRALLDLAPTVGARIGHALALSHAEDDPAAGLALLDDIDHAAIERHQPWWAARADLLARARRPDAARPAYRQAIALTADPASRRFLETRLRHLDRVASGCDENTMISRSGSSTS